MAKQRIAYIDFLKGFTILLVILGHCIEFNDTDYWNNIVFRYIYSFHMPLFMFLSGYVSY
jgi:fucose 4-O-acetylase-like acetyltransferase